MSRDMKPRQRAGETRKRSGGGVLLGLFVGLVIGVLAAAAVVWYIHRTPPPFSDRMQQQQKQQQQQQQKPGAPLALPGKPGDPVPKDDEPRFDFYTILEGKDGTAPDPAPAVKPDAPKPGREPDGKDALKEPLFLQTGSFLNAADADNQKAGLAMIGIEAAVQQVMLQDKVWYRVRLGPLRSVEEVQALRAELARQGIEANVVKKD